MELHLLTQSLEPLSSTTCSPGLQRSLGHQSLMYSLGGARQRPSSQTAKSWPCWSISPNQLVEHHDPAALRETAGTSLNDRRAEISKRLLLVFFTQCPCGIFGLTHYRQRTQCTNYSVNRYHRIVKPLYNKLNSFNALPQEYNPDVQRKWEHSKRTDLYKVIWMKNKKLIMRITMRKEAEEERCLLVSSDIRKCRKRIQHQISMASITVRDQASKQICTCSHFCRYEYMPRM